MSYENGRFEIVKWLLDIDYGYYKKYAEKMANDNMIKMMEKYEIEIMEKRVMQKLEIDENTEICI
jgi:hypothetical protein